jgi:hypothetical protein
VERSLTKGVTVRDLFYRRDLIAENQLNLIHENIDRHSIDFFRGTATLEDAHTVRTCSTSRRFRTSTSTPPTTGSATCSATARPSERPALRGGPVSSGVTLSWGARYAS